MRSTGAVKPASQDPRTKWLAPETARRYRDARWTSAGKRARDPRAVEALLARYLPARRSALVLDAPCGTARLRPAIEAHGTWIGLDVSAAMLGEARALGAGKLVCGDLAHAPFADGSFDAVVCCRLLHHLEDGEALERTLRELVRVTRDLVVASFWDAAALPEWRRRAFPSARTPRRIARGRGAIARALEAAGAEAFAWRHSLRFVSRQAFVVARKRATAP